MSIASVSKLISPKMYNTLKEAMVKGYRKVLPHESLKASPEGKEIVKELKKLGYKDLTFKGGIKGDKNMCTGLLQMFSKNDPVGYVALGLDVNKTKPIVQLRGKILPPRGTEPVQITAFADFNKKIPAVLDNAVDVSYKGGKLKKAFIDGDAVRAHVSGDLKEAQNLLPAKQKAKLLGRLNYITAEINKVFKGIITPDVHTNKGINKIPNKQELQKEIQELQKLQKEMNQ